MRIGVGLGIALSIAAAPLWAGAAGAAPIQVTSSAFKSGDHLPSRYARRSGNVSPPLTWTPVAGAGAYAIICYGPNYDFMRSKSRRPLQPPLTLSRYGYRAGGNNGAAVSGNRLSVTAPRIVPSRRQPAVS